jgi:hypothetical protein
LQQWALSNLPPPAVAGGLAALWPVALSQVAARRVPFNLWRAFKELRFSRAGGPTLAFTLVGPFWAWFFLTYHPGFSIH